MSGVLNSSHTAGYTWDLSSQNQIAGQAVVEPYQRGGMRRKRRGRKSRRQSRRQSRRKSRRHSMKSKHKVMKKSARVPKFEDYDTKPVIGRM